MPVHSAGPLPLITRFTSKAPRQEVGLERVRAWDQHRAQPHAVRRHDDDLGDVLAHGVLVERSAAPGEEGPRAAARRCARHPPGSAGHPGVTKDEISYQGDQVATVESVLRDDDSPTFKIDALFEKLHAKGGVDQDRGSVKNRYPKDHPEGVQRGQAEHPAAARKDLSRRSRDPPGRRDDRRPADQQDRQHGQSRRVR